MAPSTSNAKSTLSTSNTVRRRRARGVCCLVNGQFQRANHQTVCSRRYLQAVDGGLISLPNS
ncbi:hypothetical protein E2C01_056578 [Portunus trituberculatus]|uniref:Uncharacterized protein n=1 Tax=Portunus trituberculatus TaxID=210409 RepID=A0A5B7GXU0_PORTR|nr:hypothetical protein [Portunus trituberculatus]